MSIVLRSLQTAARNLAAVCLVCLGAGPGLAEVWHVRADAPPGGDGSLPLPLDSVQEAIRRSSDGDTVLVDPGVYRERIDFLGREVVVRATGAREDTILDAQREGTTVVFRSGEGRGAMLVGMTVRGGSGTPLAGPFVGGGILIEGASPTLANLHVERNGADLGGGVACLGGEPLLLDSTIALNEARSGGGGVYADSSACVMKECVVRDNRVVGGRDMPAGGGLLLERGADSFLRLEVRGNMVRNGDGGGVAVSLGANPTFESCELVTNDASQGFGGGLVCVSPAAARLDRSRIAENTASAGAGLAARGGVLELGSCRVEANVATARLENRRPGGGGVGFYESAIGYLEQTVFEGNTSTFVNGLRRVGGGAIAVRESELTLDRCSLVANEAFPGDGGGLIASDSTLSSRLCRFEGNRAGAGRLAGSGSGGALHLDRVDALFEGERWVGNVAEGEGGRGGGLFAAESTVESGSVLVAANRADTGAGAFLLGGWCDLAHATFVDNSAMTFGSALLASGSSVGVTGSIFVGVTDEVSPQRESILLIGATDVPSTQLDVTHSVVDGGFPGLGNLDLTVDEVGFVDPASRDYHLRLDSPCIDRLGARTAPGVDFDGDAGEFDGDFDGVALADLGADEVDPIVAARYGNVGLGRGRAESVLRLNDAVGDDRRTVELEVHEPFRIDLRAPLAGPDVAPFVLYGWAGRPDASTLRRLPRDLGWLVQPAHVTGEPLWPTRVWNNLGHERRLGRATRASMPAPSTVIDRPNGVGRSMAVTFQGLIVDNASASEGGVSVTNAIILEVR